STRQITNLLPTAGSSRPQSTEVVLPGHFSAALAPSSRVWKRLYWKRLPRIGIPASCSTLSTSAMPLPAFHNNAFMQPCCLLFPCQNEGRLNYQCILVLPPKVMILLMKQMSTPLTLPVAMNSCQLG
uniref:Uncharacterized protein n=1 Tax=Strigops habroptila TaxID=2489341 RepID=A0A672VG55_STRHB